MTDHPQEAERSAGGGKDKDSRNLATRRRQAQREEVLERLRNAGLIQQVLEDAAKLSDESVSMDSTMAQRIKAANDLRLKLVNKWLPDVKAVEVQDEDGNTRPAVGFVLVPAKS
jgi:hypothetical protein